MLTVDEAWGARTGVRLWSAPAAAPVSDPAGFAVLISAPRSTLLTIEEDLNWLKDARTLEDPQRLRLQLSGAHEPLRDPLAKTLREARISQEPEPYIGFDEPVAADLFDVLDQLLPPQGHKGLHGLNVLNRLLGAAYSAFEGSASSNRVVRLDVDGIRHIPTIEAPGDLPVMNRAWSAARQAVFEGGNS